MLGEKGLDVGPYRHVGRDWFQIDFRRIIVPRFWGTERTVSLGPYGLATPEEMEELADGVYTPDELLELWGKRRVEENERNKPPAAG